jgi:hypothetical protein
MDQAGAFFCHEFTEACDFFVSENAIRKPLSLQMKARLSFS